jgi:hypothetical protein
MSKAQLQYQSKDGPVPLFEADHEMAFKVYKSDRRKAVVADPLNCIEAKGLCRNRGVREAHIGTGGDAFVVMKHTATRPFPHALHFIIPAASKKVRDLFETKKNITSQVLTLMAPTAGRTILNRRRLNKARREAIKKGAPIKKQAKPRVGRLQRLGMAHRPRAKIEAGMVSLEPAEAV